MATSPECFYDNLSDSYHLIFEDWDRSIAWQAAVLGQLLERYTRKPSAYVLDCACGIGTQTIGLAQRGHSLVGSDLSSLAVERARTEAKRRGLDIPLHVADMLDLSTVPESGFDAALIADNALPHLLTQSDLEKALAQICGKLTDAGVMIATLRDYDALSAERPSVQPPAFYVQDGKTRFVHQVWQWESDGYVLHVYITVQTDEGWSVKHYVSRYRALLRADMEKALLSAGFTSIEWLDPRVSSFYQPVVVARRTASR